MDTPSRNTSGSWFIVQQAKYSFHVRIAAYLATRYAASIFLQQKLLRLFHGFPARRISQACFLITLLQLHGVHMPQPAMVSFKVKYKDYSILLFKDRAKLRCVLIWNSNHNALRWI